jgi:hypothetical protein
MVIQIILLVGVAMLILIGKVVVRSSPPVNQVNHLFNDNHDHVILKLTFSQTKYQSLIN